MRTRERIMGTDFIWDRGSPQISLVLFVNAADAAGISIGNLEPGDELNITELAGMAAFDADQGNPVGYSILGLLLSAGEAVAVGSGHPEFTGPIDELEGIARQAFGLNTLRGKVRDAYGLAENGQHKARQEGGILISLPGSGGPYRSGEDDKLWIQDDGERSDSNLPPHIEYGFFPRRNPGHNRRLIAQSGRLFVTAWDWKYSDNAGYYKVYMTITRG